ncbi:transferase [Undibacterium sp. Di27W]|uniref:transferase n=1 Tax=Undibacterium sp. Di27W TaxID=3413036 RepID=UPI003BF060B1
MKNMKPIVIFGLGKISDVVYQHIVRDQSFQVLAFTCDRQWLDQATIDEGTHQGLPVIAFEDLEKTYPPESVDMIIAMGYQNLNASRLQKCAEAKARGYHLVSYVSPKADHGQWLNIGENCVILDGVGIQPCASIGNNVFIWNNALIGHHSTIKDDCWIAAGVTIGGSTTLGERCFVGLNATLGGEITVGADNLLGGASLILKNTSDKSVFIAAGTEKFRLDSPTFLRMTSLPAMGSGQKKE